MVESPRQLAQFIATVAELGADPGRQVARAQGIGLAPENDHRRNHYAVQQHTEPERQAGRQHPLKQDAPQRVVLARVQPWRQVHDQPRFAVAERHVERGCATGSAHRPVQPAHEVELLALASAQRLRRQRLVVLADHYCPDPFARIQRGEKLVDAGRAPLLPGALGLLRVAGKNCLGRLRQMRGGHADTFTDIDMQADDQQAQQGDAADQFPEQRMTTGQAHGVTRLST